MTKINGHTQIVGVIGDPVQHSRSPQMHNAAILERKLDCVYVPFHVRSGELREAIEGFKADIHKRWNEKTEDQKRRELVSNY